VVRNTINSKIAKKNPLVYILILSYNSRKWLKKCLDSVYKTRYTNYKIILIDNASTDGSVDYVKNNYPKIIIIRNKKNFGWCKANNIGIQKALEDVPDYIVFLNADILADDADWLTNLLEFAKNNANYKIYGCIQYEYNAENWDMINNWTKYILFNGNKDVFFMWENLYINSSSNSYYNEKDIINKKYLDCYFVQGAAMMVNAELFQKIGKFDETFFIFYDEIDFSRKARLIGYKTALVTASKIKHYGSGDNFSSKKMRRRRNFYYSRNKYIFLLTDVNRSFRQMYSIIRKWIKCDFQDAVNEKNDISDIVQLIEIIISLMMKLPKIILKRYREKRLFNLYR